MSEFGIPQKIRTWWRSSGGRSPGGVGGAYRAFGETLRGLKTTLARLIEGPLTIQYPEEKTSVYPRFRGRHKLHKFEDTGLEKCVGCSLCAAACPADCIRVVAAENIPGERVSAGERYAAVYEINLSPCIFCGYCEVACPFDAITMGHDYEMADYDRDDLIFTKEMLLAEPIERTPLKRGGRVGVQAVLFFLAAIGALGGAVGVVALRNPFYSVLALIVHLFSLAVLFLLLTAAFVAAAQVVVYAGAVMVLDDFFRRRLRGRWGRVRLGADSRAATARRRSSPSSSSSRSPPPSSPPRSQGPRPPTVPTSTAGFGNPAAIGTPPPRERFLVPFEASSILLLIAAVGAIVLAGKKRRSAVKAPAR